MREQSQTDRLAFLYEFAAATFVSNGADIPVRIEHYLVHTVLDGIS